MLDYDQFDAVHNNTEEDDSDAEIRRARLSVNGKINKKWRTKLQIAYDGNDEQLEERDLYLRYSGWKNTRLTIGKFKQPFGLENVTSSRNITSIERSMASNAFRPGRQFGISLAKSKKRYTWSASVFNEDSDSGSEGSLSLLGRYTFTPINNDDNILHLGVSGAIRDWSGGRYRINETAEVNAAVRVVDSPTVLADTISQYAIEAAWVSGPFAIQSEAIQQNVELQAPNAVDELLYYGFYTEASFFITGESRNYKKGRFTRVKPKSTKGAWQISGRYSVLDALENTVGTEASNISLGINYYLNKKARFMLHFIKTELKGADATDDIDGNAISFRAQYVF